MGRVLDIVAAHGDSRACATKALWALKNLAHTSKGTEAIIKGDGHSAIIQVSVATNIYPRYMRDDKTIRSLLEQLRQHAPNSVVQLVVTHYKDETLLEQGVGALLNMVREPALTHRQQ